jgi:hypothetical protein
LYAKYNKCDFFPREIKYLGHTILEEAVVVDPEKIKTIMDWKAP